MFAGLEASLFKLVAPAAAKALGSVTRTARVKLRNLKASDLTAGLEFAPAPALSPLFASEVEQFLRTPELAQLLLGLANEVSLRRCGHRADARMRAIRDELEEQVRLHSTDQAGSVILVETCDWLFDVMTQSVAAALSSVMDDDAPARTRARLNKCAAGLADASLRNSKLFAELDDLAAIHEYEKELCAAIRDLHANMRLPHAGTTRQVPYDRLFVQPSIQPLPDGADESTHLYELGLDDPMDLAEFLELSTRLVLLGNPGGGKSTTSLKVVHDVASGKLNESVATTPFLVILRDYGEHYAQNRLSIRDYLGLLSETPYAVSRNERAIEYLLRSGRAFVVFDGLDELLDTSLRRGVVEAVEGFAHRYPLAQVLVTSRSVGYEEAPLDSDLFPAVQLNDFGIDQVEAYTRKWFSLDESTPRDQKQKIADGFLADSIFVQDLRANPLMLSLMCGIYSSESYIPRNRPDVYEKCALLLFERWDKQRGINSPLAFDAHVQSALRALALWLYPRQEAQTGLPRHELITFMKGYLREKRFDDEEEAEEAATQFIDFCKGRAWVLTDVGSELYGFTHRTFLEYFAASQLVRVHRDPKALFDELHGRIVAAEWIVVTQLALQILSKNVEDGADEFLQHVLDCARDASPPSARKNLLMYATRILQFVVPKPAVLRAIVAEALSESACDANWDVEGGPARSPAAQPVGALVDIHAENFELVSRYSREELANRFQNGLAEADLAFALRPTMYNSSERLSLGMRSSAAISLWSDWAGENWRFFSNEVQAASGRFAWLGQMQLRRGSLTGSEFMRAYGVRAAFDFKIVGRTVDPPIAYTLQTYRMARESELPLPYGQRVVAEVVEALESAPSPWIRWDSDYSAIATYAVRTFPGGPDPSRESPELTSAALLFAIALWEWANRPRGGSRRNAIRHFVGRSELAANETARVLDDLALRRGSRRVVNNWVAGLIDLVDWSDFDLTRFNDSRRGLLHRRVSPPKGG